MSDTDEQMDRDQMYVEKMGITVDQIAEMKESFALYDKGDEGVLVEDVGSVLRAMGQNPTEEDCKEMTNEAESMAQNGSLTIDDFITIAGPRLKSENQMEEDLNEACNVFDKLGTGFVHAEELFDKLLTQGEVLGVDDISELRKLVDIDKDGNILTYDFVKKMTAK